MILYVILFGHARSYGFVSDYESKLLPHPGIQSYSSSRRYRTYVHVSYHLFSVLSFEYSFSSANIQVIISQYWLVALIGNSPGSSCQGLDFLCWFMQLFGFKVPSALHPSLSLHSWVHKFCPSWIVASACCCKTQKWLSIFCPLHCSIMQSHLFILWAVSGLAPVCEYTLSEG